MHLNLLKIKQPIEKIKPLGNKDKRKELVYEWHKKFHKDVEAEIEEVVSDPVTKEKKKSGRMIKIVSRL